MNKTKDWNEDWEASKKIDGVEYSPLWPHTPCVTFDEAVEALSKLTTLEPSPERIKQAHKKTKKVLETLLKPTDEAKKAMKIAGILSDTINTAKLDFNRLGKAMEAVVKEDMKRMDEYGLDGKTPTEWARGIYKKAQKDKKLTK